MEKTYKHLGYFLLLMIPLIFVAFYKTYIVKFPDFGIDFDNFIHLHAILASVWVFMLIVQPFLIINKKMAWHRLVGKASYIIFPLLILSFIPGIIKMIDRGAYRNIFFPVGDCVTLIVLYSLAIYYKKLPAKLMRFMIASCLPLLGPTIGRIGPILLGMGDVPTQTLQYFTTFSILISLIFYDRKNRRNYQPYLIAVYLFCAHAAVFYTIFLW